MQQDGMNMRPKPNERFYASRLLARTASPKVAKDILDRFCGWEPEVIEGTLSEDDPRTPIGIAVLEWSPHLLELYVKYPVFYDIYAAVGLTDYNRVNQLLEKNPELVHVRSAHVACCPLNRLSAHPKMIRLLWQRGVQANLLMAVAIASMDEIRRLLAGQPEMVLDRNTSGDTALTLALAEWEGEKDQRTEIVRMLIDHGSDINVTNNAGMSPLCIAAAKGLVREAQLLISKGVDICRTSSDGLSALGWAAFCGRRDMVEFLVRNGATMKGISEVKGRALKELFGDQMVELLSSLGAM